MLLCNTEYERVFIGAQRTYIGKLHMSGTADVACNWDVCPGYSFEWGDGTRLPYPEQQWGSNGVQMDEGVTSAAWTCTILWDWEGIL